MTDNHAQNSSPQGENPQGQPQGQPQQGSFPDGQPQGGYQQPGQGAYHGGQAGAQGFMGNGYPVKTPFNPSMLFKDPDQRWPLINAIIGYHIMIVSFFAWGTADLLGEKIQITGTGAGDGWITLILGLGFAILNGLYLTNVKLRGKIWVPIVSIVVGALVTIIALVNLTNVGDGVGAGFGLILTLLFGMGAIGVSVMQLLELNKRKKIQY